MSLEIGILLGALIISIIAFLVSYYAVTISRRNLYHQALIDIQKDYRSSEMMSALDVIWDFYRECNNKKNDVDYLKEQYETRVNEERERIYNPKSKNPMKVEEGLNYKRRLITHFYIHLASIYKHRILPRKMIFDWWTPFDFEIFNKLIIPLQQKASEHPGTPKKETKFALEPLIELEYECNLYFNENKDHIIYEYNLYKEKLNSIKNRNKRAETDFTCKT